MRLAIRGPRPIEVRGRRFMVSIHGGTLMVLFGFALPSFFLCGKTGSLFVEGHVDMKSDLKASCTTICVVG